MKRPLIGITAYNYIKPTSGWRYDVCYGKNAAAIEDAGGLPVLIPSMVSLETLRGIYERLDAVMLPGGGDINPSRYNTEAETDIKLYEISDERDEMEISMTQWAIEDDLPLFGICRGIQVLNVALGGSLVQDIPARITTDLRHTIKSPQEATLVDYDGTSNVMSSEKSVSKRESNLSKKETRSTLLHDVHVKEGSLLASVLGQTQVTVNSIHHQALRTVAPRATISATAPDGVIEGIELPDKHFVLGVQWHPEDLVENDVRMQNLFTSFVEAARQRL